MVENSDKLEWHGLPADTIAPGVHVARCIGSNTHRYFGKLFLQFQIVVGADRGKTTFTAFNLPLDYKIHSWSKYYKTYTRFNGRPSIVNPDMSPRVFEGRCFKVRVERKYLRDIDGERLLSEDHEYGYVAEILEEVVPDSMCKVGVGAGEG